jgi:hypothetical protein
MVRAFGVDDEEAAGDAGCGVADACSDVASNLTWCLWVDASAEIVQVSC